MQHRRPVVGNERGAALIVMIVAVVVAAGLAFALAVVSAGRQKTADHRIKMEAALAMADAGIQRGLAEANLPANKANPLWPPAPPAIQLVFNGAINGRGRVYQGEYTGGAGAAAFKWNEAGQFVVTFTRGDFDLIDDDGDGPTDLLDAVDESKYILLTSTGYVGKIAADNAYQAQVQCLIRKTDIQVSGAVFLQDPTPSIALGSGASWLVSGKDYDMTNPALVTAGAPLPAIATNGDFGVTEQNELNSAAASQLNGTVPPWQENVPSQYDMPKIVQWARDNCPPANHVTATGTNPAGPFGTAPSAGVPNWQITFHDAGGSPNTVKFTGGNPDGAGIWVIDGDVEFGGDFNYTGIIICTGRVYYRGGGNRTFLGCIIGGQSGVLDSFDVNGNASIKYSSNAVASAMQSLATYGFTSWRRVK